MSNFVGGTTPSKRARVCKTDSVSWRSSAYAVTLLLLLPAVTHAHLPALFGRDYVLFDPADAQPEENDAAEASAATAVDLDPYDAQLEQEEGIAGPYAQGLVEPLYSKGYHYRQQGEYDAAIDTYLRALHVARVNDGLTSKRQLPILRELMATYRESEQPRSLDQAYEYLFRLYDLGTGLDDESLDASLEYLQWQREAHNSGIDGTARNRIIQAYLTNDRILEALYANESTAYERLRQFTFSQLYNVYIILGIEPVQDQLDGLISGYNHGGQMASGDWVRQRVERLEMAGSSLGEDLLERLIDRSDTLPDDELAALYLELGDWFQWNSSYRNADAAYLKTIELLSQAGRKDLVNAWLHEPAELPDEREIWHGGQTPLTPESTVLTLRFDLSQRGDASNFEVLEETVAGRQVRLKRMLRETHFRPRWSSGTPEGMKGLLRQYRILD